MDSRDRPVVLLTWLSNLNNILRLGVHEPLRQRIIMNYNLYGLVKEEEASYVVGKLRGPAVPSRYFRRMPFRLS